MPMTLLLTGERIKTEATFKNSDANLSIRKISGVTKVSIYIESIDS